MTGSLDAPALGNISGAPAGLSLLPLAQPGHTSITTGTRMELFEQSSVAHPSVKGMSRKAFGHNNACAIAPRVGRGRRSWRSPACN
jgi:hypothetical protein